MKLYHGSNQKFEKVDLNKSKDKRDFGKGFYMTTIENQAILWASTLTYRHGGTPYLYTFDFDLCGDINIKEFEGLSVEWLEMVKENRTFGGNGHNFDVVIGPVANDNTTRTIAQYVDGIIDAEYALNKLRFNKLNDQLSIHSEKALKNLKLVEIRDLPEVDYA